jgi:hypothetical protein
MTRRLTYLALGLALVLALSSSASAQRGGGFGRDGSYSRLLRYDAVLAEIEATDEQKTEVANILEATRGERPDFGGFRDLSPEEREKRFAEMREAAAKRDAEVKTKLEGVLLAPQMKRLGELRVQRQGISALSNADVAAALGLSDMQKETIAETIQKNSQKVRELYENAGENREGLREKADALRKEGDDAVLNVLSDEQKTKFNELKGEAFEFPRRERGDRDRPRNSDRPDA